MKYCYSVEEMRRSDRAAIEGGTPSLELMERAGTALADAVEAAMVRLGVSDALFVCGGGNNGGDGFVAARILLERGKEAAVLCLAEKFSPDCAAEKARFSGEFLGVIPRRRYALVVDCILGTGLSRAPEGAAKQLIEFCGGASYVISADLPSGLSENGIALTPCVRADETVTMGLVKRCLLMADGPDVCGRVTVADIGIPPVSCGTELWEEEDVSAYFPKRKSNTHKGAFGRACLFAAEAKYPGAVFLAAGACLRSGAGYTELIAEDALYSAAIGKLSSCVLRRFEALDGDILSADCIALGMGAGVSERLYAHIAELMEAYTGTLVIDADGLNTLAKYGVEVLKHKSCRVILTPHPKEFSRLTGRSVGEVLASAAESAQAFAKEYGVVVALKNNRTLITDGQRLALNLTGTPALAKGGSGDVLSGLLAGTCARGVPPFEAACVASYLIGRAGELAAEEFGEYSVTAEDVISRFGKAVLSLQNH